MEKIYQGAEAVMYKDDEVVRKERVKKGYRIEKIDEALRAKRTRLEARLIREARRAGVAVPQVINEEKFALEMEFIDGEKIRDILDKQTDIAKIIGESIAKLHDCGIIHGDLTTSNMILKDSKVYFIDFGLGFFSQRIEDKATDLHLLREVLESTHFLVADTVWKSVLEAYKSNCHSAEEVIKTLSKIEKRGRYMKRG
ncbi:Kae1-associated serine/threonine protein kinase [archaeon]|nr:Kae1-associated serine/threonine protein kinase [archaeon]